MSTARIRPAQPPDGPRLQELQGYLSEPSPALLTAALDRLSTESLPHSGSEMWRLIVSPDHTDEPVGYLLASNGTTTHIAELVVAPSSRREKRATALLDAVCASTPRPVTVCVAAQNEAARSLYGRYGFVEIDRQNEQFDSGDGLTLRYDPAL